MLATSTIAHPASGGLEASDAELAAGVRERDGAALARVYDAHGSACYGVARRVLGDDGLAQDVVQEVFVGFWQRPHAFDPARGSLATWLRTITHHRAVDAVRREQAHRSRRQDLDVLDNVADVIDIAEHGERAERRTAARAALRELPHAQRQTLALAYYGGLTQTEIATRLGIPLGTVKTRTFAAMSRLRALLSDTVELVERGEP